jgi:hypothetical protein
MDEIVKAALKKWPSVPHCYGWLALDARGDWYMRDERIQRAGPFPAVKGSRIQHEKLREFIERNYEADERGAWYFQNGPQRVYLQLEAAPLVLRVHGDGRCADHTGQAATVTAVLEDETGRVFAATPRGLAIVHPQDVLHAADLIEAGRWPAPEPVAFAALAVRYGHCLAPQPG